MKYIITERQYRLLIEQPESVMDKRTDSFRNVGTDIGSLSVDNIIDIISAAVDTVPGLGNLASFGIDTIHALSYIVRLYFSKTDEERIEYASMAFITMAMAYAPVGGNVTTILARGGVKQVINITPYEIRVIAKKLGLLKSAGFFLAKSKFKYSFLLFLAKVFRGKLGDVLNEVIIKIKSVYDKIKTVKKLNFLNQPVTFFINILEELSKDVDFAVKIVDSGEI